MNLSKEMLEAEAGITGFRPEVFEKVHHLLNLLEAINQEEFLRDRLALKGGTALNLFLFDLPRLSVDIDLNLFKSLIPLDLSMGIQRFPLVKPRFQARVLPATPGGRPLRNLST